MATNQVSLRIGGPAGAGIMQAGLMFSKCCSRIGLHVFDYIEYPSLVRGGHNTYQVRAEAEEVHSQIRGVDVLIALDEATISLHKDELRDESVVIYDGKVVDPARAGLTKGRLCSVPFGELASEDGSELMQNTIALGAALGLISYPFHIFEGVIKDAFKGKTEEIISKNIIAAKQGYTYAQETYGRCAVTLEPVPGAQPLLVLTGNEAIALGAVQAGLKFYAAYPMTPASSILHTLAALQEEHGITVKQCEDEISVANMTVGAGFAGVRAMCATSGGGYALMGETLSLAGMTETPAVFVEVQRGGPGTGIPTFTEQADLRFVLHAGHGDFPKPVLAPGDVEQAFHLTMEAFNLAEEYQTPVVILSDKYLGESHKSAPPFTPRIPLKRGKLLTSVEPGFQRYADTPDGISPRTIPGVPNGIFLANSDEHEAHGYSTEEIPLRNRMHEKRMRKLATLAERLPDQPFHGPREADLTIISWGSTRGPILDAMKWLERDGYSVNFLQVTHLQPFPVRFVTNILSRAKRTLVVEENISGQFEGLLREQTGFVCDEHLRRYDGRPFYPEQIYDAVRGILGEPRRAANTRGVL